ncbi:phospholipid/cholesterol/gamma-HCH transport system substrate-binding protein [Hamadaea flava]|uniref:MCE family protein n=1 Tax=Hamadaea flava TaxID=1742688 RepID=A0ABV8LHV5_9ACTN|nr:MCE family protein [Hamadaea flava]MCP2325314.1 phospholipid/cholesterol/gamma-HCH transport system substrate-binding protein [Hamadaea flava]
MRLRLLGLGFVVLLVGSLTLSVLAYRKAFTPVDWVTLRTDHTGMQLATGAEVKLLGVQVGEVREITANGSSAELRLAIDPDQIARIPADVSARLLPKTLFGERYVELVPAGTGRSVGQSEGAGGRPAPTSGMTVPAREGGPALRAGAVIAQDRTSSAVELEQVLDRALPVLQAIKPDKLAATLGALAYALDGRGQRLGQDLANADEVLAGLNKQMPTIATDVRRLAQAVDGYNAALPDLLTILRNVTVTATTVADQKEQLAEFLADATDLADNTRIFLDRYDDRIIQLGRVSRPVLELLAAYAPEYPCFFQGLTALQPQLEEVFAGSRMHITLEVTRDNGKYVKGRDEPVYGARNGPQCHGLPNPKVPAPSTPIADGYDYGAGAPARQPLLRPIVAALTGTQPDQVSDLSLLLWGPLLNGQTVNLGVSQ